MARVVDTLRGLRKRKVVLVRHEGTAWEQRFEFEARILGRRMLAPIEIPPTYEGDVLLVRDPTGADFHRVTLASPLSPPTSVRPLGLEGLHPQVEAVAGKLFADGHYSQAVFEALKALEQRVRAQSHLDVSGRDLMAKAFTGDPPPIDLSVETGQSGRDEQEGLRLVFMGLIQGIRNPKGHALVKQDDPQRAHEYLGTVSVLLRRLDDAAARAQTAGGSTSS